MPSSRLAAAALPFALLTIAADARADVTPQGFAVERLTLAPPGEGWFVMNALDNRGGLGGAASVTSDYDMNPLRVSQGGQSLAVVTGEAFVDVAVALTYDRWRLTLGMPVPLVITGDSGAVGGYAYTAPGVGLGSTPDLLADPRVGLDVRLFGEAGSPLRLGASGELIVPTTSRDNYDTDGTYRAMLRAIVAGDFGRWTYAAHLGFHLRPLDDRPIPGSPAGSELLFGGAFGARFVVSGEDTVVLGPEIFGESALQAFFGASTTGVEGLFTGRYEMAPEGGPTMKIRLGTGGGIDPNFGAPEWRVVLGVEVSQHR